MSAQHICALELRDEKRKNRGAELEHEREAALRDLLVENHFIATAGEGPYRVVLKEEEGRLAFEITDVRDEVHKILLSMQSLKRIIRDYFLICESYYSAIKTHESHKIEAIDMGRRGLHNEGAERLQELLAGKITLDFCTARRLFTLICVLHMK